MADAGEDHIVASSVSFLISVTQVGQQRARERLLLAEPFSKVAMKLRTPFLKWLSAYVFCLDDRPDIHFCRGILRMAQQQGNAAAALTCQDRRDRIFRRRDIRIQGEPPIVEGSPPAKRCHFCPKGLHSAFIRHQRPIRGKQRCRQI